MWPWRSRVTSAIVDVDDRRAVDLPELRRIELVVQLLDRAANQELAVGRHHHRVLVVRLEVAHTVDGDETHFRPLRRCDPAQVLVRLGRTARQRFQNAVELGGHALHAVLQTQDGSGQPLARVRLQDVIGRLLLEGCHRVFVVCRDEHDVTAPVHAARDLEPVLARHLDVEEGDVGSRVLDRLQRFRAIGGLGADLELGPQRRELLAKLVPQNWLVFSDDRCRISQGRPPR
jgi:hypothetical protein